MAPRHLAGRPVGRGKAAPRINAELSARDRRFAIVASRFNDFVVRSLVRGAQTELRTRGAAPRDVFLARVPGAFEIPAVALRLARTRKFDAVICLGAVIRGDTPHFDFVAGEAARGIAAASLDGETPVIFGVLTTNTVEQAEERARTDRLNTGAAAARAAIEMAELHERIGQFEQHGGAENARTSGVLKSEGRQRRKRATR